MLKNFFKKKKVVYKSEKEYRLEQYIAEIEKSEIEKKEKKKRFYKEVNKELGRQDKVARIGEKLIIISIIITGILTLYKLFVK